MADDIVIAKDMAYNRRDLLAGLARAFGDVPAPDGDVVRIPIGTGSLTVVLGQEAERRIALMRVIHMPVTLTFSGLAQPDADAALLRFDRAFQRGGG